MENEYRPFFSRKQLNVLMWFSLLAILVLSSLGPGDVEYQTIEHNKAKTVYWMELDDQLNTLTLLLPTPPALNSTHQQLQQLKAQVLLKRLQSSSNTNYTYNVYPRQDRIELSLHWAGDNALPDIPKLLHELQQPVDPQQWESVLKTLEARDYLEHQGDEEQVIQQFYNRLQPSSGEALSLLPTAYSSLFQGIKYVLSGEDAEDHAEALSKVTPPDTTVANPLALSAVHSDLQIARSGDKGYIFLNGMLLPPRNHKDFVAHRITAQLLQDLLAEYKTQYQMDYRLLWAALNSGGYQAVLLRAGQNPQAILPQLQQLVTEERVEASQNRLAAQWQERMRELQNQIQAMNLIAYYDLPTSTMEDYIEQIQEQDVEQVIKLAQDALSNQPISHSASVN